MIAAAVAAVGLAACSGKGLEPSIDNDGGTEMFSISFRVSAPSSGITRADGYEDGVGLESTIDIASKNFRIYFFDVDGKYITEWQYPNEMHVLTSQKYWLYTFTGVVPKELELYSNFSVMVLANWPDYPDRHEGISLTDKSIDDFVGATWACFDAFDSFELSIAEKRLIPFYGLASYKNITFAEDDTRDLGSIDLLRAMAKVEVTLTGLPDDVELEEAPLIRGINPKGYCAPLGPIGTGDDWDTDYVENIHLPFADNKNSPDAKGNTAPMLRVGETDTWIAYLPEFDNKNAGEDYSRIELKLSYREEPFVLNFATYGNDGRPDNVYSRFDIRRNDLYRFNVKGDLHEILFNLEVEPWEFGGKTEIEM